MDRSSPESVSLTRLVSRSIKCWDADHGFPTSALPLDQQQRLPKIYRSTDHGDGSGASADNSLRSAAEALKGSLVSDGKRLEIRHFCFAACGSSIRQEVFAAPKSLDAPEPSVCASHLV